MLETKLAGAAQVKAEMERLLASFETERVRVLDVAKAAIARTPSWTSGFLDGRYVYEATSLSSNYIPSSPHQTMHRRDL